MSQPKATRVRLRGPERHQQLLDLARRSYLEVGIDRTSMHKVAQAAGVNIATMYQHFASTDQLFREALLDPLDASLADQMAAANERLQGLDTRDSLRELHRSLLRMMNEHGTTLNAVFVARNELGRQHVKEVVWPSIEAWVNEVLDGLGSTRKGAIRPALAPALAGVYLWLSMHEGYRDNQAIPEHWAERIADLLYAGAVGPPHKAR